MWVMPTSDVISNILLWGIIHMWMMPHNRILDMGILSHDTWCTWCPMILDVDMIIYHSTKYEWCHMTWYWCVWCHMWVMHTSGLPVCVCGCQVIGYQVWVMFHVRVMGTLKMGNIVLRAGLELTWLPFWTSVVPLHHIGSMMSPRYPHSTVYAASCLRDQFRLLHSPPWNC